VAATKTYTAQLVVVALLACALSGDASLRSELDKVPDAVAATLALEDSVARAAERYVGMDSVSIVGRGYNYATALEIAIKLKELSYTSTTPYSSADFLHGPIAVVGRGTPVMLVAPGGQAYPAMLDLARTLAARRAEQIVISDQPEIVALGQCGLLLPAAIDERLSPITAVLPGQLLGYYLALARGLDPESPRGLTKVTETR
jgi:glucosamine--fructose-6-phosphate aminotransferase (isomerizing)